MNDFLQLQTRSMAPYIFATVMIGIITVIAATVISWHAIRVIKRENPGNKHYALDRGEILFKCFFPAFIIVFLTIIIVPTAGDAHSIDVTYDRNMKTVQSAYNIRDVRQNARTSGGLHATVQAGRNSEQNTTSIWEVLSGDEDGSATVTAISNGSDSLGHYIFRVDDNHRLRVYQDTKDGTRLITPAVQNHTSTDGAIMQSSIR